MTPVNFRGIKSANILLLNHVVFIGDNNTGKSTIFEAIDLVLRPDRLSRRPPIDEHDFHIGRYLGLCADNESGNEEAEFDQAAELVEGKDIAADAVVNEEAVVEVAAPEGEPETDNQENPESEAVQIKVEAVVTDLSDEQRAHLCRSVRT